MFNTKRIRELFAGLVGFERPANLNAAGAFDDDLSESSSGLMIGRGVHPLLAPENIDAVIEQFATNPVGNWDDSVKYQPGALVTQGGEIYEAVAESTDQNPETSPTYWKTTTRKSAYLRRLYNNAVTRLLSAVFTSKKLNEAAKTLLANVNLYEGQGNISRTVQKQPGRFVGFRLTLRHADTLAILSRVGLQITDTQTVTLYLFHSSSVEPLATIPVVQTKAVTFQWHDIAQQILQFTSETLNTGGHYYLGYYEDDLQGNAVAKEVYFDGRGCGSCSQDLHNRALWQKWAKFIDIQAFYVTDQDSEAPELWDEENEMYLDGTNFGLNLRLAVQCDLTDWLDAHKNAFADALVKQITVDLLTEMAYSMRDNQKQQKLAGLAAVALDNTENHEAGALRQLSKAIAAMDFDFSDLSPVCNPCNDGARGVKYRNVWGR